MQYQKKNKKKGMIRLKFRTPDNKKIIISNECSGRDAVFCELPLPCGTVVPMEVASNSRDSYPFLTKRLAVRTNQGIFTYAAISSVFSNC